MKYVLAVLASLISFPVFAQIPTIPVAEIQTYCTAHPDVNVWVSGVSGDFMWTCTAPKPIANSQIASIRVYLDPGSNKESQDVIDQVSGTLGNGSRYALVSDSNAPVDVELNIKCLLSQSRSGEQHGVVCVADTTYHPVIDVALSPPISGLLVIGPDTQTCARDIFDDFVKDTSEEKIKRAAEWFRYALNQAIATHPNGVK